MGIHRGCNESFGAFAMWSADKNYDIDAPLSQFFASQLINLEWVQPGDGVHKTYAAASDLSDPAGHNLVTAYALERPDGQWSLMLVNRDQENAHKVKVVFQGGGDAGSPRSFSGPLTVLTFGSAQYHWHPTDTGGYADPDGPVTKSEVNASADTVYELPKASMTVLKGRISNTESAKPIHKK
jgi:hypothetical protein